MTEKAIVFDSGPLISLAMNGLLPELRKLKEIFNGKFLITNEVQQEIITKPLSIKRFELEALQIKELIDEKILERPEVVGISSDSISKDKNRILKQVNAMFYSRGRSIHLIDDGEASCLSLNRILIEKGYKSVIAVDERTTRLLGERPENLKKLMEDKLHMKIEIEKVFPDEFKRFVFLRSTELMYVAWKRGLVRLKGPQVLDAILYGLKFKGAAISSDEIEEMKRIS